MSAADCKQPGTWNVFLYDSEGKIVMMFREVGERRARMLAVEELFGEDVTVTDIYCLDSRLQVFWITDDNQEVYSTMSCDFSKQPSVVEQSAILSWRSWKK